jgi:beta-glucosidase
MAVVATAKHFAGHGVPEGGMNSAPPHIGPRELREVFLPPFEAAVRVAGVASFMHAYHEIDGIPCIANRALLLDTLRSEWGFTGTMVSDYNGIEELAVTHRLATDLEEAAAVAIEAGVDVELPSTAAYGAPLRRALHSGRVAESDIDRSVARVLRQKFELGLFENALVAGAGNQPTNADRALAHRAAQRSLVLLENEAKLLPLSPNVTSIAVIGPTAADPRFLLGDYSQAANLETMEEARVAADEFSPAPASPVPPADLRGVLSVLDAINDRSGPDTKITYAAGCGVNDEHTDDIPAAVAVAADADVAVVVAGGRSGMTRSATCGEFRDRTDLGLPGSQQQLLDAVVATGTPVVLILLSGRPLSPDTTGVRAVLHAWLPGGHGAGAVAGALFGDFSPGGKLPITVPRHVGQVPIYHGHKPTGGGVRLKGDYVDRPATPRYPFGFGLSYTTFEVTGPQLAATTVPTDGSVSATVHVINTGSVAGDEVVQIYARRLAASVTRPVRELVGFARIALDPGEARTLTFHIPADLLGFIDREMRFAVEPGPVTISAGTSALDIVGTVPLELVGPTIVAPDRSFFSSVEIG